MRSSAVSCLKSQRPQTASWTGLSELVGALQKMQGRWSPGIDGLTVEFYMAFWDISAADILAVFNESDFRLPASVLLQGLCSLAA